MRSMRPHCLLAGLLLFSCMHAQTGPGGVGNSGNNVLWLDAENGVTISGGAVSAWADRSGNGNNAMQSTTNLRPLLSTDVLNGHPALVFDNDDVAADNLVVPDNATLEGMSGLSGFAVYRLATGSSASAPRGIFSKRTGIDEQEAYSWFMWNPSGTVVQNLDIDGTSNRVNGTAAVAMGVPYVNSFVYKGSSPSNSQNQVLYNGNTAVGHAAETSTSVPNYASDLYVGILKGHTGSGSNVSRFNGEMAEVIIYNYALGDAQRIIVTNYLAAKYGLALASGDLYVQDNVANGDYDNDVAGIGQVSATDHQLDSRGTGIVEISGATDLGNDEFLLWGSDSGALGTFGVGDRPDGILGRWQRTWRVNEVNSSGLAVDVGAVDIAFDLSGQGAVDAGDLRLLIDTDKDGLFSDETPIGGAIWVSGNSYRFTGVTAITDGVRFTLGTVNTSATPLPIDLLFFSATVEAPNAVRLDWSTASEQDNDHFTVQRSMDLDDWGDVGELPGAGNSSSVRSYSLRDPAPLLGNSYYRLRQTDVDGTSTLSDVVAVNLARTSPRLIAYPDPAHDLFLVADLDPEPRTAWLINGTGARVEIPFTASGSTLTFDVSRMPSGTYTLVLDQGVVRRSLRIVLN